MASEEECLLKTALKLRNGMFLCSNQNTGGPKLVTQYLNNILYTVYLFLAHLVSAVLSYG